jgi:SAM-dependent methyltransferase
LRPRESAPPPLCDYEGSSYRTDFWEGQRREYEDGVERQALRALLPPGGRRVLDLGAGFGRLAGLYTGYDEVVLLDYSQSQLEYARQRWGDERFVYAAADLYRLPVATDAVDATVMVRVLHHIADVPAALEQIARVTRPQGALVLEFANKRHLKNILRYLVRRGMNPFAPQPYEFSTLHFDFHPAWIDARLSEAGFAVERRRSVSLLRAGWLKRHLPTSLLVGLDGVLQRPTAALALGPSQFVRARVEKLGTPDRVSRAQLFRCPTCEGWPLQSVEGGLRCPQCEAHWPLENGVYVFKAREQ